MLLDFDHAPFGVVCLGLPLLNDVPSLKPP